MNQNNKHTPLTPDEIVKLLEQSADNITSSERFDDFEQDAIEGFQEHVTPEQAKLLMADMQFNISKKAALPVFTENKEQPKKIRLFGLVLRPLFYYL